MLPTSSYGSLASVFLHLLRDWSAECEHVYRSTYGPAIRKLCELLPEGEVLVPGAGLGRLALELAKEGYKVEANDASRLFLTFGDYVMNRPPEGASIFPLAHVFSENRGLAQQYMEVKVPSPTPESIIKHLRDKSANSTSPFISLVPGEFAKLYKKGCPGHRRFDAILTCFFIDTATDVEELFKVMDGLLGPGGVWVNIGPLNWRKEARLKLSYEEIVDIWTRLGYDFVCNEWVECDYHIERLQKMYTESYYCALTAAVKHK